MALSEKLKKMVRESNEKYGNLPAALGESDLAEMTANALIDCQKTSSHVKAYHILVDAFALAQEMPGSVDVEVLAKFVLHRIRQLDIA